MLQMLKIEEINSKPKASSSLRIFARRKEPSTERAISGYFSTDLLLAINTLEVIQ
jgi:hypothetical protein